MKTVVLDGFAVNPGDLSWNFLGKYGDYEVFDKTPDELVAERIGNADAVFTNRAKINGDVLNKCPDLRFVGALGTGYDMIDVAACRERGVLACNIPAYSTDSVAQLSVMMLLELTTDFNGMKKIVTDGNWTGVPGFRYQTVAFTELAGLTLGLVGCGNIGKRVAAIARAFGMHVLASTRTKTVGEQDGITYMTLDEMLPLCDAVSLHCPLNDVTRGMVDRYFIGKMKTGAVLINTARGALLNEKDVRYAVDGGKLGGVAADVLTQEPPQKDNWIVGGRNTIVTPHIAWTSIAARRRLVAVVEDNLASFVATGDCKNRLG